MIYWDIVICGWCCPMVLFKKYMNTGVFQGKQMLSAALSRADVDEGTCE